MTITPILSATARLEQDTFRVLVDGMARPGTVALLTEMRADDGSWAAALAVLQSLLDHEVTFALVAGDAFPREQILRRTGSRPADVTEARFILADAAGALAAVQQADHGTIEYPHESGTVVIAATAVGNGPLRLRLTGPGVDGETVLALGGVGPDVFEALAERNEQFPLGIDVILAGQDGRVACVPRSTKVEVQT